MVAATTSANPGLPAELNLFFERGLIGLRGSEVARWEVPDLPPPSLVEAGGVGEAGPAVPAEGHLALWRELVAALREGRLPLVTPQEALDDIAIVLGVYESSRTGQAVRLRVMKRSPQRLVGRTGTADFSHAKAVTQSFARPPGPCL